MNKLLLILFILMLTSCTGIQSIQHSPECLLKIGVGQTIDDDYEHGYYNAIECRYKLLEKGELY